MKDAELDLFLTESSIERQTLERWIERRWIRAELTECDAARALFIRDLRTDFEVNDDGIELVLRLVDQVHGLRRVLRELRDETNTRGGHGN